MSIAEQIQRSGLVDDMLRNLNKKKETKSWKIKEIMY
jgi:hypothetical protein